MDIFQVTWSEQNLSDVICSPRDNFSLEVPPVYATAKGIASSGDNVTSGLRLLRDELGNEFWLKKSLIWSMVM